MNDATWAKIRRERNGASRAQEAFALCARRLRAGDARGAAHAARLAQRLVELEAQLRRDRQNREFARAYAARAAAGGLRTPRKPSGPP